MAATTLDTTQLAKLLDITPRRVRQLTAEGILVRARDEVGEELAGRYEMIQNNHAYIHFLREQARLDDASESKYVMLRNARMDAERQMAELRLKQHKGQLLRVEDVEFWITNALTAFKSRIQSMASNLARRVLGQTNFQVTFELISTQTELALGELSTFNSSWFAAASATFLAAQGADERQLNGAEEPDEDTGDQDGEVAGGFAPDDT